MCTNTLATVFIVDDDPSVLKSLNRLVRSFGYQTAIFRSSSEFLAQAKIDTPGCLISDIQLPDLCGFSLQKLLTLRGVALPVIFLTGHGDIPMSVRAIKAGAVDFLTKPCNDQQLLTAIVQAITLNLQARQSQQDAAELKNRFAELTRRERQVCNHLIDGHLNKQIATDLGICVQTIKVHRMRIMEKLNVQSPVELLRLAEKAGIRTTNIKYADD